MSEPDSKERLRDIVYRVSAPMEVKAVLHALLYRMDRQTLTCWPSIPEIARGAGCNEDTARKWLRVLVASGAVRRFDRWRGKEPDSPGWTFVEEGFADALASIARPVRGGFRKGGAKDDPTPKDHTTWGQTSNHPGAKDHTTLGANKGPGWGQTSDTNPVMEPRHGTPSWNPEEEGEPEGASLTTPPTSDPDGSVPPADLTSATEAPYAPTSDPTPEHVNETSDGDRAEGGDVSRVVSGGTVGLFGAKWAAALAPEPTPEPKPAPVETVKERNRRERAERAAALAAEVNTVWQAYAARHPHAGRRGPDGERLPSEADAHRIAGAVTEWGTADVLLLLDWAHDAPDDQATWLQGKRSGTAYLGLANLLVADKASGRLDIARQWHAHGRPLTMPEGHRVNGRQSRRDEAEAALLAIEASFAPARRIIDMEV